MSKRLVHTPEGVRDIYGKEYAGKWKMEGMIHDKFFEYGYQDIQTPTFEFFDVFSREIGTTPSKELYKFFDKEGNTLVLRPDFTPSMARCAAKYFMDEDTEIRFSYLGNTFTNTSNLQGKLKEVTQMGVELIGNPAVEADGEVISLLVESLKNSGLKEFQISVGEVEYFKGICQEAGLDEETELQLREYISNKNYFGAESLLSERKIPQEYSSVLLRMTELFGGTECLTEAKALVKNARSLQAVERLEQLYQVLCLYGVEQYVSFDLGMLSKYNYYTGVIFKAYTYGVGDAIAKGGRYDSLLSHFGKDAPAIGFMIIVDDLMSAVSRQGLPIPTVDEVKVLSYTQDTFAEVLKEVRRLRNNGMRVEMRLES